MQTTGIPKIADRIENAFREASQATGTNFEFLLQTAKRESNFDPNAQAKTSSAAGLFQFIESTWLETLKEDGPRLGYEELADKIRKTSSGKYAVTNRQDRQDILNLRFDPDLSAKFAGAYAEKNADQLRSKLNRDPSAGELYIAHFLGPTGGAKLINAATNSPEARADNLFPQQAKANKPVFYHRDGRARDVGEVYRDLVKAYDQIPVQSVSADQVSPNASSRQSAGRDIPREVADSRFSAWSAKAPESPFHGLFRDDSPTLPLLSSASWMAYSNDDGNLTDPSQALNQGRQKRGAPLNLLSFLRIQPSA